MAAIAVLEPRINAVEELAARIQLLPVGVRWIHAQQDVIQAVAVGREPVRGPWTRRFDRILSISDGLGAVRPVVAVVNLLLMCGVWVLQFATSVRPRQSNAVFVGIGALRERVLVEQFETIGRE